MMHFFLMMATLCMAFMSTSFASAEGIEVSEGGASDLTETIDTKQEPVDVRRQLIIGVRQAARPFAYGPKRPRPVLANISTKSGPLRAAGYEGYMVYICDEVLKQMLIVQEGAPTTLNKEFDVINVDNEMEKRAQQDLPPGTDRFSLLDDDTIDILCDPASINRDRVRRFAASPPLFLTGIGYLYLRVEPFSPTNDLKCTRRALVGVVGTTNATSAGISAILEAGEWHQYRDKINKALRSGSKQTVLKVDDCEDADAQQQFDQLQVWYAKTHSELAQAFCNGLVKYYVGDLEIISEHVAEIPGCEATSGAQSFTSDRYAVFADINYEDEPWKAVRIARFFEILNREIITSDSLLDRAYSATFGNAPRSPKLNLFFWSIRGNP